MWYTEEKILIFFPTSSIIILLKQSKRNDNKLPEFKKLAYVTVKYS